MRIDLNKLDQYLKLVSTQIWFLGMQTELKTWFKGINPEAIILIKTMGIRLQQLASVLEADSQQKKLTPQQIKEACNLVNMGLIRLQEAFANASVPPEGKDNAT